MQKETFFKTVFSLALTAVMVTGMLHLTAEPARASINCELYTKPGCEFVGVVADHVPGCGSSYCCHYVCSWGAPNRYGPCWEG